MADTWEQFDIERLRLAVEEIARSPNLRYLFRSILTDSGILERAPTHNALETARAEGRRDLGLSIIETMLAHNAALYPELILEDQHEQRDRASNATGRRSSPSRDRRQPADDAGDAEYS